MTLALRLFAQDLIVRADDVRISCKVTKIDSSDVIFNIKIGKKVVERSIKKNLVREIKYNVSALDNAGNEEKLHRSATSYITLGFLEGGGSLFGVDIEVLLVDYLGIQVGAGLLGYGAGLNFHVKPSVSNTFFSFQYWHQGIGASHTQTLFGPNLVFRGKKWFTAQIGYGFRIQKGPAYPAFLKESSGNLTYAIGAYIPL